MLKTLGNFKCETFTFEDKEAIIVFPEKRDGHGRWALKTEYWGAYPDIEIKLLERGFHIAFLKNDTRFATADECGRKARFVQYISEKYSLSEKCVPIGMSCGGAHAMRLAGLYPDRVSCLFIDAPVLNYCSFPGKVGDEECERVWEREFVEAYPGIERYHLVNFHSHPICLAFMLKKEKIPVIMVYGSEDKTVIYEENGYLLEEALKDTGLLKTICVSLRGHHPHGLIGDNTPIVDFIDENSRR